MKKTLIISIVALCSLKSIGQTPVLDLHTADFAEIENAYYKDIEGFFNQFVGTWGYTDGIQTIRLQFRKREMVYSDFPIPCYVDYLVGEAQYSKNGLVLLNSLDNLTMNYPDIHKYNIVGITKVGYHWYPRCEECPLDVERLFMSYDEATNDDFGLERNLIIRRVVDNGVPKLKIQFVFVSSRTNMHKGNLDAPSTTQDFTIPFGDYTLLKEN